MPSRHTRKAKSNINSYDDKKTQRNLTKSKKSTQSTPAINVTDASPTDLILHSSWKVLYIFQFLSLFRHHLNIPSITIDELESILRFRPNETENENDDTSSIQQNYQMDDNISTDNINNSNRSMTPTSRESSVTGSISIASDHHQHPSAAKLLVPLLASLYDDKKRKTITDSNYPEHIFKYMYHHSLEEDIQEILGRYPDRIDFTTLSLLDKICILKELVDCVFETGTALQWKNNLPPEDMRTYSIGKDSEGWSYYVFGDSRLYREIATSPRKKETDYTFELVASTQDEWQTWMDKFSLKSSKVVERSLAKELQERGAVIIQKFENKKAAKLREEAKLEKAKKLDMLPRKRSRRIEVKSEEDDRRRQLDELERAQLEYEELQKEQERKEQEELAEKEKQLMSVEDARLKEQVYQLLDNMVSEHEFTNRSSKDPDTNGDIPHLREQNNDRINQLKYLRTKLKKSATYGEALEKLTGWANLLDDNYKVVANMEQPILIVEQSYDTEKPNQESSETETTATTSLDFTAARMEPPATGSTDSSNQAAPGKSTQSDMPTMPPASQPQTQQSEVLISNGSHPIEQPKNENISSSYHPSTSTVPSVPEPPIVHPFADHLTPSTAAQQQTSSISDEQQKPINAPIHNLATFDAPPEKVPESTPIALSADVPIHEQKHTVDASQPSNNIEPTISPNATTTHTSTQASPTVKRGRPRKPKKPVINTMALLPAFSEALQFTGNGTKSDLRDPVLKLILSTMISQIRQHPIIAQLEQRADKKIGKKRKTAPAPATATFYTIHKKLLLNEYSDANAGDSATGAIEEHLVAPSTENGLPTATTDEDTAATTAIKEENGNITAVDAAETKDPMTEIESSHTSTNTSLLPLDRHSAFDKWLEDMDLLLKPNDSSNLELKYFIYDMFRLVFSNENID